MRGETKDLNDAARSAAGGSFIQLTHGVTHYEISSPLLAKHSQGEQGEDDPEGRVSDVVLVPGFSVPYYIYDPTFEFLTGAGFRTLRYDLFGRGFSDRPAARNNLPFFVRQLTELLDQLRFTRRLNLIGLSMGGPIAAAFTAQYPERVERLILIGPVGVKPIVLSPLLQAAKIPLIPEAVLSILGDEFLLKSVAGDFFDTALVERFLHQYKVQLQYKGFRKAILSTIRNNMLGSFVEIYERLGTLNIPVLLFWGRQDSTVPFEHSQILLGKMPHAEFHIIENCGHIPHYERPAEVNPILLSFLRRANQVS